MLLEITQNGSTFPKLTATTTTIKHRNSLQIISCTQLGVPRFFFFFAHLKSFVHLKPSFSRPLDVPRYKMEVLENYCYDFQQIIHGISCCPIYYYLTAKPVSTFCIDK